MIRFTLREDIFLVIFTLRPSLSSVIKLSVNTFSGSIHFSKIDTLFVVISVLLLSIIAWSLKLINYCKSLSYYKFIIIYNVYTRYFHWPHHQIHHKIQVLDSNLKFKKIIKIY